MNDDPIVEEVRKIRQELFERCGNDLQRFMEFIRQAQLEHNERVVTSLEKRTATPPAAAATAWTD